jgi:6-pyruvoyltetrahydropterin/6-carboxytetrahydropterin synthase
MSTVRLARRHPFQMLNASGENFSPKGPTHHFELEVYIEGEMNEKTGMVVNIQELDRMIGEVLIPFREQPLEMASGQLAVKICQRIRPCMGTFNSRLIKVRLFENPDLWFDVWA